MNKSFVFPLIILMIQFQPCLSQKKETAGPHLFPILQNGKYGYIDKNGTILIKPQFDMHFPFDFSNGLLAVQIKGKTGFINTKGQVVIQPIFEGADNFSEGLAAVTVNGKRGYIDTLGKIVIEAQFDQANPFQEGLAVVEIPEKVITNEMDEILGIKEEAPKYDLIHTYKYIDKKGNFAFPLEFNPDQPGGFYEGMAQITIDRKTGFIDKTGKIVIPPKYDYATDFKNGLASVRLQTMGIDEEWHIDKTGKRFGDTTYEAAGNFSEGLAAIRINSKWGFIDKTGKIIIEPKYDGVGEFSEGLVQVELNKKWGYIDKTGKTVIDFNFNKSGEFGIVGEGDFHFGLARVKQGTNLTGYIDKTGKFIWKPSK